MVGAAIQRRLTWQIAKVSAHVRDTPRCWRISFDAEIGAWLPGQHVDVRLTAPDGYQAQRSYSIASAPEEGSLDLVVERLDDGEVSPYLTDELRVGDAIELRGPIGGYFVWQAARGGPVQLIAGGSGVAPFLSMLEHHRASGAEARLSLLYSARTADDIIARDRLDEHRRRGVEIDITLTREAPDGWSGRIGRVDPAMLADAVIPASAEPQVFVCGPTAFVEGVAEALVAQGHVPAMVKTERFGG